MYEFWLSDRFPLQAWVDRYKEARETATAELFTFLVQVSSSISPPPR